MNKKKRASADKVCDLSLMVTDSSCDQGGGGMLPLQALSWLCRLKEQSPTGMLGALLKQVVDGLGGVPGKTMQAYEDQRGAIGG